MTDSTDKRLPRLLCEPHDGSRSLKFLKFKRDYRASMRAEFLAEDEYSLWANVGLDPGAGPGVATIRTPLDKHEAGA
jgi:hypothetical protein